ncbi:hypothetical protein [Novosphingobium sp.]|uniref:hypothetical protein n=1 Tax=Novosphingobium sp. TaxID=1874826 RepID=UPI00333F04AE
MHSRILQASTAALALAMVPATAYAQTQGPFVGYQAADPSYGSPTSMPVQNAQVALDLFNIQAEGTDTQTPDGDSDTIGGAFTYGKAGLQKLERYDLHYQHARRIGEGSRMRFLLDVPVNIIHADLFTATFPNGAGGTFTANFGGATAVYGTVNAGIEVPVKPNFTLTPRASYSNLQTSTYFGKGGERAGASITSRYKFAQVGRGDLVIGGMVDYSHTLKLGLAKQLFFQPQGLWTLRGGLAYQMPLKSRMFGRQSSFRASYVFTALTGIDHLPYNQIHELGISIGVRTREAEQKSRFEQIRMGLLYTHSPSTITSQANYDAATLTLGYRF